MIWNIITAIATLVSMCAYIVTVYYIRVELKSLEKDRYLAVTNGLYAIWQSKEFMEDQLWLLHHLQETTWESFVQNHRADRGEMAFHRVGSFYDRIGTLVRMELINEKEVLSTMGGYAIAVWQKISPLVKDARQIENSILFDDFERLLPSCYECYVPSLGKNEQITPFSISQPISTIEVTNLFTRLESGEDLTILDVRQPNQFDQDPRTLPKAIVIPPDQIGSRFREIPSDKEVIVYCA